MADETKPTNAVVRALSAANPKTMGCSSMTLRGSATTAERCWVS